MEFWEGFWQLPQWYVMVWLGLILLGLLFVLWELAHRKMKISKEGITFDRLSTRKGLLTRLIEIKRENKKIPIDEV